VAVLAAAEVAGSDAFRPLSRWRRIILDNQFAAPLVLLHFALRESHERALGRSCPEFSASCEKEFLIVSIAPA
jgi:hypothetical protein